jgi:hypothetical protein
MIISPEATVQLPLLINEADAFICFGRPSEIIFGTNLKMRLFRLAGSGGFPGPRDEDRRVRAEYSVLPTCITRL